jgi:diacylglycerol kinase
MSKNKHKPLFSIKSRIHSFRYSFRGIFYAFGGEPNLWIHLLATILVVVAGFVFELETWEWALVILCIGFVIMTEFFNSALEYLCDAVHPQYSEIIKKAKDISAAAVLISAIAAAIIGLIIFVPKFG